MTPPDDHRTRPDFTPTIPFESGPADPPAAAPASAGGYQAAASAPALEAGQLLAGRFRIVRFIAQGGMGEVWEAEDLELPGERVALKTVRPSIARDAWAMGRFRREIQLGRKITHPNVCRIFDVFHHRPGSAGAGGADHSQGPVPAGDLTFLTMELLSGETLERRLERDGRLGTEEALPIVRHLAAALQAAHEAEISHGDFKSSNVMLIGGGDNLRAVVTDFGLSRGGGAAAGLMTSVPAGDHLVGTPAYMAPEQVRGERSSAAADIYALGIVMFEMLTGRLPFQAETAISSAVMRLSSPPPPPRTLVPDLDPRWDAVVLRCLALDPADRFARAADVARALEADTPPAVPMPRAEARADRRFRSRRAWLAAAVAILLAAGVAGLRWRQRSAAPDGSESAAAPAAARPAIAVLGFKNASGRPESAWLSTALAEMLATELGAGNQMRVIPSENVARMRVELGLADFSTLAGDTLDRVRGILGSDLVVLGSYTVLGPEPDAPIRLDLSLQDALAGHTRTLPARNATAGELFELVRLSGADLRRELGAAEPAAREGEGALAAFSTEPEAARLYAEGLALLRRFEGEAARAVLERAVEADPRQPLAHSALAAAWAAAGYDERATAQAKRAFELSRALPLEQRLEVEGRYREIAGEWPLAIEIYRTLYGNYPDHLDYGLRLVEAQVGAGAGAAARSTLAELRRLPGPAGGDPRLDLASAQIAESLSEFAEERDAARRAADLGRASGARLLVARARLAESWAQRNLDQPAAAKAAAQEARTIYAAAGDRAGAAQAVNQLGIIAWQGGDLEAAAELYEEARASFSALGDRRGVARALNNTAILLWERQDWPAARAIYERVVDIHRETGSRRHLASTLNNLGIVLREEGRLDDSVRTHREALQIQRSTGELQGQAQSLNNLAQALELQGDVAGARTMTVEALKIFREIGSKASAADALINIAIFDRDRDLAGAAAGYTEAVALKREASDQRGLATALTGLGAVLRLRGEFAAARTHQEEALALRRDLGELARPFVSEIELARLALDEGASDAAGSAERAARAAAAAAESAGDAEATAEALLVLARALLEQGRLTDSAQALREGASDAAADPAARLGYLIANAQLDAAGATAANRSASQTALQKVAAEADRLRLPEMAFEARLALAELALAGDAAAGSAALARLRDEANAQGFGAVAARAVRRLARAA